ncbi:MAG: rhodanese-like domain-containing protein [Chlorobium sp.]|nr:MAG: rhodanese-like domain-containing protein [Chlorobium sp.]
MNDILTVKEIMPRDFACRLAENPDLLILDVREPDEFDFHRIEGSVNVPLRMLERACERGNAKTVRGLAEAGKSEIVVICRSGYRSYNAAAILMERGYEHVVSLKTGLNGWSDFASKSRAGSQTVYGRFGNRALSA